MPPPCRQDGTNPDNTKIATSPVSTHLSLIFILFNAMPTGIGPATFSLTPATDWDDGEDDESPDYSSSEGDNEDVTTKASVAKKRIKNSNT